MGIDKTSKAHQRIRDVGHPKRRGKPAGWINSASRAEVCKKISDAKKKANWMIGRSGPLSPVWRGGTVYWRGNVWKTARKATLERDGYRCIRCGLSQAENLARRSCPLQVDHIVPYRFTQDNSLGNLQTLCNVCHGIKGGEEYQQYWSIRTAGVCCSP